MDESEQLERSKGRARAGEVLEYAFRNGILPPGASVAEAVRQRKWHAAVDEFNSSLPGDQADRRFLTNREREPRRARRATADDVLEDATKRGIFPAGTSVDSASKSPRWREAVTRFNAAVAEDRQYRTRFEQQPSLARRATVEDVVEEAVGRGVLPEGIAPAAATRHRRWQEAVEVFNAIVPDAQSHRRYRTARERRPRVAEQPSAREVLRHAIGIGIFSEAILVPAAKRRPEWRRAVEAFNATVPPGQSYRRYRARFGSTASAMNPPAEEASSNSVEVVVLPGPALPGRLHPAASMAGR